MSRSDILDDIWQFVSTGHSTTNCIMPKYLLTNALKSGTAQLPLLFKITHPQTNQYAICAADEFYETDEGDRLAMLPQILINYLELAGLAIIELINNSPDLIPKKAKTIYLEPQDELFYKVSDPKKILENTLQNSYIYGQNYMIPIRAKSRIIYLKVSKIVDSDNKEIRFANINNIDLNVEFLPLPQSNDDKNIIEKIPEIIEDHNKNVVIKKNVSLIPKSHIHTLNDTRPSDSQSNDNKQTNPQLNTDEQINPKSNPKSNDNRQISTNYSTTSTSNNSLYDPKKKWIPFCGKGYQLSTGQCVAGRPQPD